MPASLIVEHLDEIEDFGARRVAGLLDPLFDAFFVEAAEEGLDDGIIPAVATSAHAGVKVWRNDEWPIEEHAPCPVDAAAGGVRHANHAE